jgi:hypothetical protein
MSAAWVAGIIDIGHHTQPDILIKVTHSYKLFS